MNREVLDNSDGSKSTAELGNKIYSVTLYLKYSSPGRVISARLRSSHRNPPIAYRIFRAVLFAQATPNGKLGCAGPGWAGIGWAALG